jgi:hypothetical protein
MVALCLHSPLTRLHGVGLNYLSTGTNLSYFTCLDATVYICIAILLVSESCAENTKSRITFLQELIFLICGSFAQ